MNSRRGASGTSFAHTRLLDSGATGVAPPNRANDTARGLASIRREGYGLRRINEVVGSWSDRRGIAR